MKLSLIIQAIDRATAPLKKVTGAARDLAGKGLGAVTRAAGATDRALGKINRQRFAALKSSLRTLGTVGFGLAQIGAYKLGSAIGSVIRKTALLSAGLLALGASAGAYAAGRFFGGIISASSRFEQIEIELEGIERSAMKAAVGIDFIKDAARRSVVPIDDLAAAYVKARKAGIAPGGGTFKAMTDEAVASKKTLEDIVDAMAGAKGGDYGGLQALDITAAKAKGRVLFTFLDKTGKRVVRNVGDNAQEVERALTKIFEMRSAGSAERKLSSFSGLWQALKNNFVAFQDDIGRAGIFDWVKQQLADAMTWLGAAAKDGRLKKWAEEISKSLKSLGEEVRKFIFETDWKTVGADLRDAAGAAMTLARALAALYRAASALKALSNIGFGRGAPSDFLNAARYFGAGGSAPGSPPPKGPAIVPGRGPMRPGAKPMAIPQAAFGAGRAQVGGKVSIELRTQPGTTAVVKSASSINRNVPIEINTGRVRAAA